MIASRVSRCYTLASTVLLAGKLRLPRYFAISICILSAHKRTHGTPSPGSGPERVEG